MDKDRESTGHLNSKQELHRKMQQTRQSMSKTLGEIEGEISHALDWQTYFRRHPGAFLIGGGALGFIIGRAITGSGHSRDVENVQRQAGAFDGTMDQSPKLSSENSSIRRIIDMTASALLAQVVPILSSKLRNLVGIHAVAGRGGDTAVQNSVS
jgi:hypothetical protein